MKDPLVMKELTRSLFCPDKNRWALIRVVLLRSLRIVLPNPTSWLKGVKSQENTYSIHMNSSWSRKYRSCSG